jgi:deazaflavin-dependent oxidoreductase (nitroreductase family)
MSIVTIATLARCSSRVCDSANGDWWFSRARAPGLRPTADLSALSAQRSAEFNPGGTATERESTTVKSLVELLTGRLLWWLVSLGLTPSRWPGSGCGTGILEVKGRRSGVLRSLLVTWVEHDGERYLVTMPGQEPQWVKNMRAAGGEVVLRHGNGRNQVHLQELPANERAPVLQAWYRVTGLSGPPRRHFKLGRSAAIEEFERIAADHPVFRIEPIPGGR